MLVGPDKGRSVKEAKPWTGWITGSGWIVDGGGGWCVMSGAHGAGE